MSGGALAMAAAVALILYVHRRWHGALFQTPARSRARWIGCAALLALPLVRLLIGGP